MPGPSYNSVPHVTIFINIRGLGGVAETEIYFLLLKKQTSNNKNMHNGNVMANTNLATGNCKETVVFKSSSSQVNIMPNKMY